MLRFDVLLVFDSVGKGFVTRAALQRGELRRPMVLRSEHIRVVGPIVVPQTRQLLQGIWQVLGFRMLSKLERETGPFMDLESCSHLSP